MSNKDVFFFKMNNGDNIISEVIFTEQNELGQKSYILQEPMVLEYREMNGQYGMTLNRLFSFTDYNMSEIKDKDIVTMMNVNDTFCEYYFNTVRYNYLYVDKSVNAGIKDMNISVSTMISNANQDFVNAMKKYNIDPDSFIDQLPN